jgi:hypothetical protein
MAIEIISFFYLLKMVIFHSYVSLPEGKWCIPHWENISPISIPSKAKMLAASAGDADEDQLISRWWQALDFINWEI